MLKKILVLCLTAGVMLVGATLYAKDKGTGCGLGSQVWAGQKGLISHLSAGTTNGTSGNQSFGLTSGTSGCDANSTVKKDVEQKIFLADNMDYLFQDMSQGKGEYLETYAALMGCHASVIPDFSKTMQNQHESIFMGDYSTDSVLTRTQASILNSRRLSQNCVALK